MRKNFFLQGWIHWIQIRPQRKAELTAKKRAAVLRRPISVARYILYKFYLEFCLCRWFFGPPGRALRACSAEGEGPLRFRSAVETQHAASLLPNHAAPIAGGGM